MKNVEDMEDMHALFMYKFDQRLFAVLGIPKYVAM